jgi:hypothetical protein
MTELEDHKNATDCRSRLKSFFTALKVFAVLLFVCLGWLMWNVNQPPFSLAKLKQLRPGMSQAEVRQILGSPESDFGDHWAYSRFMAWPIVYVRFDENKLFKESEYDY